jgi:hypothetical protein
MSREAERKDEALLNEVPKAYGLALVGGFSDIPFVLTSEKGATQ